VPSPPTGNGAMGEHQRIKHFATFDQRLAEEADRVREHAWKLKHGPEREQLLRKARQAETAAHISEWINSPGLQPPR
jgi:hypothetical protein